MKRINASVSKIRAAVERLAKQKELLSKRLKHLPGQHNQMTHGRGRGGGGDWKTVDTSGWTTNSGSTWAKKKIALLEKAAAEGDWDFVNKTHCNSAKPNGYQKAVLKAQKMLQEKHQQQAQNPPEPASLKMVGPNTLDALGLPDEGKVVNAGGWEQVGGKLGTQPGGKFKGEDGKDYYVKFPDDPNVAKNEYATNRLMEAAGGGVPNAHLVVKDGKLGIATEWTDGMETGTKTWESAKNCEIAGEDFALHAWTANWDAVGAGSENPMANIGIVNGKATSIDVGGAMLYTGLGKKKPGGAFNDEAAEWDGLRDPNVNPSAAKVFGKMTKEQLVKSAMKLENIDDITIAEICHTSGLPLGTASTMIARKKSILKKAELLQAGDTEGLAKAAPKQVTTPDGTTLNAGAVAASIPPPLKVSSKSHMSYQPKFDELHEMAAKGDWEGVEKYKTNEGAVGHYPKKLHEYKQQLLEAHKGGAPNPQPQPAKAVPKPKIDPNGFPSEPAFATTNEVQKASNMAVVAKLKELAETGDLDALKALPSSPSPKINQYKDDLIKSVNEQLHPPPPPKPVSGAAKELANKCKVVKGKTYKETPHVMKYIVLGETADTPVPVVTNANPQGKFEPAGGKGSWEKGHQQYLKCTPKERAALRNYTGSGHTDMNKELREGGSLSHETRLAAKATMEKAVPLPEGTMLSRKHNCSSSVDLTKIKPGQIIQDRGIMSTSTDPKQWSGSVHLRIRTGPGAKGLPIDKDSVHKGEMEVMLPPNTRMIVRNVIPASFSSGGTIIEVDMLPTVDSQCCPP
jgi:hypothetical protein